MKRTRQKKEKSEALTVCVSLNIKKDRGIIRMASPNVILLFEADSWKLEASFAPQIFSLRSCDRGERRASARHALQNRASAYHAVEFGTYDQPANRIAPFILCRARRVPTLRSEISFRDSEICTSTADAISFKHPLLL